MPEDWASISRYNKGGSAKEEKALEKSYSSWQYKGPIQQQEKIEEQRKGEETKEDEHVSVQEEKNELTNDQVIHTPEISLRPNTRSTQLEFSLSNFPMLSAIPIRNGFESLMNSKLVSLPVDRGELQNLVNEVELLEC